MQNTEPGKPPLLDLVIVIDSSPSMKDTAQGFSQAATDAMQAMRVHGPADVRLAWFGLEGTRRETLFATTLRTYLTQRCHIPTDALRSRRRGTVPGGSAQSDGARAIEDVARYFDWRPGAQRAMFWLGDEALEGGGNLVDDDDAEAATRAIAVAKEAGMLVHTYMGTSRSRHWAALAAEYARVAHETGGQAFTGRQESAGFAAVLAQIIAITCHGDAITFTTPMPDEPAVQTTHQEAIAQVGLATLTESLAVVPISQRAEETVEASQAPAAPSARPQDALALVKNHVIGAMAIGALPLPLLDTAAIMALQLRMIARLSRLYDVPFSQHTARSLVLALLGGVTPTMARQVGVSLFKFLPLLGPSVGTIVTTTSAGATTYAVGIAFMHYFEDGHSFLTLKRQDIKREVQRLMPKGKTVAAALQHDVC